MRRRRLAAVLALCLTLASSPSYGQSQANSPEPGEPVQNLHWLEPEEMRTILGQLHELKAVRGEVSALKSHIERDAELDARERELSGQREAVMADKAKLAGEQRDLQRERADLYEALYRSVTKRPGLGCRVAKAFTFGLWRCG